MDEATGSIPVRSTKKAPFETGLFCSLSNLYAPAGFR